MNDVEADLNEYTKENIKKSLESHRLLLEDVDVFPTTRLLDKRREILEFTLGLNQEKESFRTRIEKIVQRRDDHQRKEGMFGETVNRFEIFLEENDAKRNRAIKKAHEERKAMDLKILEIAKLKELLLQLSRSKQQQEFALQQGQKYQRYLEMILETADGFSEIKDLLGRYDALSEVNSELRKRSKDVQEVYERAKAQFQANTEEQHTVILNNNNILAEKKVKLEDMVQKTRKWQSTIEASVKKSTQQSLELGQIQLVTSNLFQLVKSHLNNRISGTTDTPAQLDKIQQFIIDLSEIVKQGLLK